MSGAQHLKLCVGNLADKTKQLARNVEYITGEMSDCKVDVSELTDAFDVLCSAMEQLKKKSEAPQTNKIVQFRDRIR